MAYVDTPASRTASFQAGVDDAVVVRGEHTFVPKGEIAPGVDGLGDAAASSGGFDWGSLIGGVIKGGADIYGARQAAKIARQSADRQNQMADDEAKRQAALLQSQMASQERIASIKAMSGINRIPGGWITVGVAGAAVLGLTLWLLVRRRGL